MKFEYNLDKSHSNLKKHGIDFIDAQKLWSDDEAITIKAKSDTEDRFAFIAIYEKKYWVAFFTYRSEKIRLISVRRARENEKRIYDDSRRA